MQIIKRLILVLSLLASSCALANHSPVPPLPGPGPHPHPWFTGSLLAPTGHTFPKGKLGFEPYVFYTEDIGHYDARWKKVSTVRNDVFNPLIIVFYGLTKRSDLQINIPYFLNSQHGVSSHGFGDLTLIVGYQAISDVPHTWIPDLKLTIAESFPTGRFDNLEPAKGGTDITGSGSFQTGLAATFQKLWFLPHGRFLRARWNFTYTIPVREHLNGLNAYGGARNTNGTIILGNHFSSDLAFEYTLTQHWVPAIDFLYVDSGSNTFNGVVGTTPVGLPAMISVGSFSTFSMAPAMEYNFSAKIGVIAGVWFTVNGRNAPDFVSGVMAVNIVL